jgi:hypothetical protein
VRVEGDGRKGWATHDGDGAKKKRKRVVDWVGERLDLPVAKQSVYAAGTFVLVVLTAAMGGLFLESALRAPDRLAGGELPCPRDLMYRLKRWVNDGLLETKLLGINDEILRMARKRRKLPRAVTAAFDYTDEPYFGKKNRGACQRAPEKGGTTWFHRVAALSIIVNGGRFTVAWVKVPPFTSHEKAVAMALDAAGKWVSVRLLMMDRGLYSGPVEKLLKARGIKVLMAAPRNKEEKKAVERCKGLSWLAEPWKMGGEDGWTLIVSSNEWLERMLGDRKVTKGYSLWLTDLPVRFTKTWTPLSLIAAYNRRWSIENQFQEEDRFLARTKSPRAWLRFCLLLLATVLRNLWLLLKTEYGDLTTFDVRMILLYDALVSLVKERRFELLMPDT